MHVIAKISCYLERSVVTLKLRKEYLNTVTRNTSVLLWIKNWTVWYIEHCQHIWELQTVKKQSGFWPTRYMPTDSHFKSRGPPTPLPLHAHFTKCHIPSAATTTTSFHCCICRLRLHHQTLHSNTRCMFYTTNVSLHVLPAGLRFCHHAV